MRRFKQQKQNSRSSFVSQTMRKVDTASPMRFSGHIIPDGIVQAWCMPPNWNIVALTCWRLFSMVICTIAGSRDKIAQFIQDGRHPRWLSSCNPDTCAWLARFGFLEALRYMREELHVSWDERTFHQAALHGHREVLRYGVENGLVLDWITFKRAVQGGHFEIMKWLFRHAMNHSDTINTAIKAGNLKTLNWLCQELDWTLSIGDTCLYTTTAAEMGRVDMLKTLMKTLQRNIQRNTVSCLTVWSLDPFRFFDEDVDEMRCVAAKGGHLGILEFLEEHCRPDCPRSASTCKAAVRGGHFDVLQWLRSKGFPWDAQTCTAAARHGHLEMLQYAHDQGCEWNGEICRAAATGGHIEILKYLIAEGCPWNGTIATLAAHGHLEALKWAHESGCPWNMGVYAMAAGNGYLDVLEYAHRNGCPWDEYCRKAVCRLAAEEGHLPVLKWARQHGCEWHEWTCYEAAKNGHLEILQWARLNGCPWTDETRARCLKKAVGSEQTVDWLLKL